MCFGQGGDREFGFYLGFIQFGRPDIDEKVVRRTSYESKGQQRLTPFFLGDSLYSNGVVKRRVSFYGAGGVSWLVIPSHIQDNVPLLVESYLDKL
jgi:hypothetical protein